MQYTAEHLYVRLSFSPSPLLCASKRSASCVQALVIRKAISFMFNEHARPAARASELEGIGLDNLCIGSRPVSSGCLIPPQRARFCFSPRYNLSVL